MDDSTDQTQRTLHQATEVAVRLTLIAALAYWCLLIFKPFAMPTLLAIVIAVALYPAYAWIKRLVRGRAKLAATIFVILLAALLIAPIIPLGTSLAEGAQSLADTLAQDEIVLPPPPANVEGWPVIGPTLYKQWSAAAENLSQVLTDLAPHLKDFGAWVMATLAQTALVMTQGIIAIIVAGILLAYSEPCARAAVSVGRRLAGEQGEAAVRLADATIHTVALGVVGVALLQAAMAGAALFITGIPAAGLLTIGALVFCVAQIGTLPVTIPAAIYLLATSDSTIGIILFIAWIVLITLIDQPIKAVFFSRGVDIPMPVILIGTIGGLMLTGITGLFIGAVVLAVGYKLFVAWTKEGLEPKPEPA